MNFLVNKDSVLESLVAFVTNSQFIGSVVAIVIAIIAGQMIEKIIYDTVVFFSKSSDKVKKNIILKSYCNLISTVLKYVIYVIAVLVILKIYGLTLTTILASAGFIGVMITYIFQDLIKDVTNGFFIVFSTPFEVGDNIKVNDFVGQVREITSRYIVLVDAQGDKCIVNNRAIDQVIVYNKGINFKKRVK